MEVQGQVIELPWFKQIEGKNRIDLIFYEH